MSTIDEIRAQVEQVLERAHADAEYFDQLKSDPTATLMAAGVPADATPELIAELGTEDEVRGYMRCDIYTCFFSLSWCGYWSIQATN